jgi:serine/threonine-protein kinase RsbW
MAEHPGADIQSVNTLLDSTLDSVETAEDAVLRVAGEIGFPEDDLHQIGMAVRESMVNAVVHGNRYNARKKVHLSVLKAPDRLTVVIADEGEGFDLGNLPDPLAEENLLRQSGRGLLLIKAFVDEFHVRRAQPSGTEVRMVKYLANAS